MDSGQSVHVSDHDSCHVCWAVVPRALMHFHRAWHADQERRLHDAVWWRNAAPTDAVLEACPPES